MATAYVTEYTRVGGFTYGGGSVPIAVEPGTDQTVSFTATAGQSSAFGNSTTVLRILVDADSHAAFGADPTATTSTQKLTADVEYWRGVLPGQKVSFRTAA